MAGRAAEQRRQSWDGRRGERGLPTRRQRVERRGGMRREQERRQRGPVLGFLIGRGRSGRRGDGKQRGGVGAAEAEAVDADHRGATGAASRQGLCGGGHAEAERGEVDGGVGRFEVQGGRDAAMLQHQQGLEQTGHAGGGFRVADVRFRGANRERRAPVPAYGLAERRRFDRISRGGAGAVRLEIGDALRLDTSLGHRLAEQRPLRLAVGEGEAHRAAGGVGGGGEQHGAHRIAVLERVREGLQQDDAGAFCADIAVRRGIESAAAAARREHPGAGKAEEGIGRQQQIHAADDRGRHPPGAERLGRPVQRDERRGAGGVHHLRRAVQVEDVADAVGEDGERAAGHEVAVARGGIGLAQVCVVGERCADEHAGAASGEMGGRQASIVQRLGRDLEQQALLRVHLRGLARGDAEGAGVEPRDVGKNARRKAEGPAGFAATRMEERVLGEAVGGHGGHRVPAFDQEAPIGVEIGRPRQPACGADDGDRDGVRAVLAAGAAGQAETCSSSGRSGTGVGSPTSAALMRPDTTRSRSASTAAKCASQVGARQWARRRSWAARAAEAGSA